MKRPRSKQFRFQKRWSEEQEIDLLNSWIEFGKPDRGVDPQSFPSLPSDAPTGRIGADSFSPYVGCHKFSQLPNSQKTKDGLTEAKYTKMTEIQRASLPHSLCGRDISGAAKTGSGKTLAFIIPVLEKLYRERWGPEDGVGCIIISPTRELAGQTFEVLNSVGKYHSFSAGLLIGGRKDVESEKEHANGLNILICTPGRLLQHMNETPNFDCTQLQVLVLDEADRILDVAFANDLDSIISQLPKSRQTLLFSATQTKSIKDLERLSLKDAEYVNVHKEAVTATPSRLQQTAIIVPLDQKLDMLWSFIKAHLNSRILVFLSSCKQVKFVFELFKKLRPGIPLKCLHGRMKQERRMGIYYQFCEQRSVLFSTDVASRGLDFNKGVDWVVQVDCPEDFKAYIHRVGRTARFHSAGRSVLFLSPSEMKMLEKLQERNIPIRFTKANTKRLQPISGLLAALLVKHPDFQSLAQRAFITYLKSIYKQKDKEVFDLMKLPIDEFSASLGLPMTPKVRFLKQKTKGKSITVSEGSIVPSRNPPADTMSELPAENPNVGMFEEEKVEKGFPLLKETSDEQEGIMSEIADMPSTRVLKKKKLKINIHRPVGKRVVFDEDGNTMPPLAKFADREGGTDTVGLDDRVSRRYAEMREELKEEDKVDKLLDRQRRKEKRIKDKTKLKRGRKEDEEDVQDGDDIGLDDEGKGDRSKRSKVDLNTDLISLREQEELALKLLSSMHS